MEKVLEYPLTPVSMSLSCADGTRCKTTKSKLFCASLNDMEIVQVTLPDLTTLPHNYLQSSAKYIGTKSLHPFPQQQCCFCPKLASQHSQYESYEAFCQRIRKTLLSFPVGIIDRTIASMHKRLDAIIKLKGQRTKY